jgi:hypothetical protein
MAVTDPEAEQETIRESFGQRLLASRHRHWVTGIDIGDPGGQGQGLSGREQHCRRNKGVTTDSFSDPHRSKSKLFHYLGGPLSLRGGQRVNAPIPDADATDIYCWFGHDRPLRPFRHANSEKHPMIAYRVP